MKHKSIVIIWLVVIGLVASAGLGWAADIKERMRDRLPVIKDLKTRGVIGENNKGYLEFMRGKSEKKEVVAAENKDRQIVYQAIAKKQGTTADLVGRRRAIQLAAKAEAGEWLQDAMGKWYRK
jgi:uncharacterized protein YdbL (DUF1318 family)